MNYLVVVVVEVVAAVVETSVDSVLLAKQVLFKVLAQAKSIGGEQGAFLAEKLIASMLLACGCRALLSSSSCRSWRSCEAIGTAGAAATILSL